MTNEEILQQIYDETLVGNKPAVVELTARGIEAEIPPNTLSVRGVDSGARGGRSAVRAR